MWPVSDEFLEAVRQPHVSVASAVLESPSGERVELNVESGTIVADRTRTVRRTCNVTLVDPDGTLEVTDPSSPLHPVAGWRLLLWRGVEYVDGTTDLVPVFTGVISRPSMTEDIHGVVIDVEGEDLARKVSDARWLVKTALGGDLDTLITTEVHDRLPDVTVELEGLSGYTAPTVFRGGSEDDPMEVLIDMAKSGGRDLAFDQAGVLKTYGTSDNGTEVTVEGVIVAASRDLDPSQTYNVVSATADNPDLDEPLHTVVEDDDEDSPTYVDGPFGSRPTFPSYGFVSTQAQLDAAAAAELARSLGVIESMDLTIVPNPAVEPGDLVRLDRLGASGLAVVDRVTLPLGPEGTCRLEVRRRVDG